MLAIPLQRGSSSDVTKGITSLLQNQFGEEFLSSSVNDIAEYQKLRDTATLVFDPSEANINILQRLHYHYVIMVPRLHGYKNEYRLSFKWIDGYRSSKSITTTCLYVDWTCFLWNLGALEGQLGLRMDRSTEEGIKLAHKYFQQAAGYFDYILTTLLPKCQNLPQGNSNLACLTIDGVIMARDLMIAQAQLCFYEKAVREKKIGKMTSTLVAKLGYQNSLYFATVKSICVKVPFNSMIDTSWGYHAEFQAVTLQAASEYWQSIAVKETALQTGKNYGEEIVRLQRAESLLLKAIALGQKAKLNTTMISTAEGLLNIVTTAKNKAIHDNKTVYMEALPADHTLTAITPISMVKPLPLPEITVTESPFFQTVLPSYIRQIRGEYHNKLEAIITPTTVEANQSSTSVRTALSNMGLPGSLESYKSGGKLPENLWNKIIKFQSTGGVQMLHTKYNDILPLKDRIIQGISTIKSVLDREIRADTDFHTRYTEYTGTLSSILIQDIMSSLVTLEGTLQQAQVTDTHIEQELRDISLQETLTLLQTSTKESLSALLPRPEIDLIDMGTTNKIGIDTSHLEKLLLNMVQLIESRDSTLAELEKIGNTDVSNELMSKIPSDTADITTISKSIINDYIDRLTPLMDKLRVLHDKQVQLLQEITIANTEFHNKQSSDTITLQRNDVIIKWEQALTRYFTIHGQLLAGFNFYTNFQSRLSSLQQSSDDLCYTQHLQRQEYETDMTQHVMKKTQEEKDHEYAQQLSSEFQSISMTSSSSSVSTNTAMTGAGTGSTAVPSAPPPHYPSYPVYPNTNINIVSPPLMSPIRGPTTQPSSVLPTLQNGVPTSHIPVPVTYGQPVTAPQFHSTRPTNPSYQYNNQSHTISSTNTPYNPNTTSNMTSYGVQANVPVSMNPTSVSIPSQDTQYQQKIPMLMEMGFTYDASLQAIQKFQGNEQLALNYLLDQNIHSNATTMNATTASNSSNNNDNNNNNNTKPTAGLFGTSWGRK